MAANNLPAEIDVSLTDLRDAKGMVQLCLTRDPHFFPNCKGDPAAVKGKVPASVHSLRLTVPAPGAYALSVIHDANANGRLDTALGIPREGFGFSRNPAIRFGPPRFAATRIEIGPGLTRQTVRLRYLL